MSEVNCNNLNNQRKEYFKTITISFLINLTTNQVVDFLFVSDNITN